MFDGSLTTIRAHERNADAKLNPTYRCLFPAPPPAGTVPTCAEAGVMGALAGVLGSMMAMEAIREIVGFGEGLVGRLLMIDALSMRFETLRYKRDPQNPLNGDTPKSPIKRASLGACTLGREQTPSPVSGRCRFCFRPKTDLGRSCLRNLFCYHAPHR